MTQPTGPRRMKAKATHRFSTASSIAAVRERRHAASSGNPAIGLFLARFRSRDTVHRDKRRRDSRAASARSGEQGSQDRVEPKRRDDDEGRQRELECQTETNLVRRFFGRCPAAPESIAMFHFGSLQWVAREPQQEARQVPISGVPTVAGEPNAVSRRSRRSMPMPELACGSRSPHRFRQLRDAYRGGDRMADRADHVTAARGPAASRRDGAGRVPCVVPARIHAQQKATGRVRDGQSRTGRRPVPSAVRSRSARLIRRLR